MHVFMVHGRGPFSRVSASVSVEQAVNDVFMRMGRWFHPGLHIYFIYWLIMTTRAEAHTFVQV